MKNFFGRLATSVKESYTELVYKVSWPTIPELSSSAVVVMFASLIIALIVFFMDFCFESVMVLFYKSIL